MRKRRLASVFLPALLVAGLAFLGALPASAQDDQTGPIVSQDVQHDVSPPLWVMATTATPPATTGAPRTIGLLRPPGQVNVPEGPPDALGQEPSGPLVSTTDLLNMDGQNADGVAPPDTEGSVGATQYVQWVNVEYNVYDKTTGSKTLGPVAGNAFWSGFGGSCQTQNDGDIIMQYDKVNNVWVAAQNVFVTPYMVCVAVSQTSDATGSYNRYAFNLGSKNFPDYPKWGIWPDGYYQSFNVFNPSETEAMACAYDGAAMRAGTTATQICFATNKSELNLLPSDQDGLTAPPTGSPNYYIDLGPLTGSTGKSLQLFQFHVDFADPSLSTFTGPTSISVTSFTEICSRGSNRACIPEPSPGEKVDSLGDRLMYRNAYRNFGTYESLLDTHTVKPGTGSTATGAVRWYEIHSPGSAPFAYQQGTIQDSKISYWMASIAQDKLADIAIGFSGSSTTVKPSVFYTGRVPTDALGTMESIKTVVSGTGVQKSTSNRWGDYSDMSIDASDDCTFFYTQEYYKTTGSFNWDTRINSFHFNSCT